MIFENKTILIISPENWGVSFVSKHHYAETLSELGNCVYFLNGPGSHFKWTKTVNGVVVVDYKPLFRGIARLPGVIAAILTLLQFRWLERKLGVRFDVIWNFDSSRFFNLSNLPSRVLKICHIVDLNQDIQRNRLASTSHICLGTTRYIVDELRKYNIHSYLLGHGYRTRSMVSEELSFIVPGNNTTKAFYVGNLSMAYIDWEILLESANKHKHIDFIFIGPDGASNLTNTNLKKTEPYAKIQIKNLENVYFCDPVDSRMIPQLLDKADYLLIAYQERYHKDQAAPHKMMEYLASGKTIIATYTEEFDDEKWKPQLRMSGKNEEFPDLIYELTHNQSQKHLIPTYNQRIEEIINYMK